MSLRPHPQRQGKKLQLFDPIKLKPALQIHSKHLKPHEHMLDMLSNHYTPTPDPSITTESSKVNYGTYQKNPFKNSTSMGPETQHTHSINNLKMESPSMGLCHDTQIATAPLQPPTFKKTTTTKSVHPTAPTETGKKLQLIISQNHKPACPNPSNHLKHHEHK